MTHIQLTETGVGVENCRERPFMRCFPASSPSSFRASADVGVLRRRGRPRYTNHLVWCGHDLFHVMLGKEFTGEIGVGVLGVDFEGLRVGSAGLSNIARLEQGFRQAVVGVG
jgi:hypothetical protein